MLARVSSYRPVDSVVSDAPASTTAARWIALLCFLVGGIVGYAAGGMAIALIFGIAAGGVGYLGTKT
jgi:hypothetical protein